MSNKVRPVSVKSLSTPRLQMAYREAGRPGAEVLVLIHGNVSSSRFFEETLESLPGNFHLIAPDMRGFGESEAKAIDATRGLRDFSDDVHQLLVGLGLVGSGRQVNLLGWSVGGGVAMQYAIDHSADVASIVLMAPMSPFGFGGTKDVQGTPNFDDFAGSGGGTANPEFVKRLGEKDHSAESDFSPVKVMNTFYFKPPFTVDADTERAYVASMCTTLVAPGNYPGGFTMSPNWPTLAPGDEGMNNCISAKYCNLAAFADIPHHPPVLWLRGDSDQIVSDTSLFDFGFLGSLGAIPGWPGAEIFPAQPMIAQTRHVLDQYAAHGGSYSEVVLAECGHSPHVEKAAEFAARVSSFLRRT